jgi:hypothetical protein
MKIQFVRWCMNPDGCTAVAVEASRVDCIEHFSPAFTTPAGEDYAAATKIVMRGKQEYIVQGTVEEVANTLNLVGVTREDVGDAKPKFRPLSQRG